MAERVERFIMNRVVPYLRDQRDKRDLNIGLHFQLLEILSISMQELEVRHQPSLPPRFYIRLRCPGSNFDDIFQHIKSQLADFSALESSIYENTLRLLPEDIVEIDANTGNLPG